ncbi:MAG: carbamoyltransferase HypF, partial [Candidatus Baltobacteraceae bacterium]
MGFRPFVYRLARRHALTGWVRNGEEGVTIHAEGKAAALDAFLVALAAEAPPAAAMATLEACATVPGDYTAFTIVESRRQGRPSVSISPDLPVCADCLAELFDPGDRRAGYAYINCTNCGPRYSIVLGLPYDRPNTTMREWPLCAPCQAEYEDPENRRFHAQPVACAHCGPHYRIEGDALGQDGTDDPIARAALLLRGGAIVAVKGIGGYHLACDPTNGVAVATLRERKYRKERPFALMAKDLATAGKVVRLGPVAAVLLASIARPIVLAPARVRFEGVAPENDELGVMLPYAPLHHLLFARGAPDVLVLTSANRSSEPIAFDDADARESLAGIADAFLVGERPIARRVDDSIVRVGPFGQTVLRRSRGYSPQAVASIPVREAMLALGGDLKNAIALAVDGQVFGSQHVGDLEQLAAFESLRNTARDLCAMYDVHPDQLTVVHDAHPEYRSTTLAGELKANRTVAVQHHRAHVASVLAERGAYETRVAGVAFDGTGYGDDGTIWGGEFFIGSVRGGLERVAHLRTAALPGGDAASRFPVQAAAGYLYELDGVEDLSAPPFSFPERYAAARELVRKDVRTFRTSSIGRLFDVVAALCGFTREPTFEGQAAMWLEHRAGASISNETYPFPFRDAQLDHRPLLEAIVAARCGGRSPDDIARGFHRALADAIVVVCNELGEERVALSGGVFQNALLVTLLAERLRERAWFNAVVPPNDGGLAL